MSKLLRESLRRLVLVWGASLLLLFVFDQAVDALESYSRKAGAAGAAAKEQELFRERVEKHPEIGVWFQGPPSKDTRDAVGRLVARPGGTLDIGDGPNVLTVTFPVGISLKQLEDVIRELMQVPGVVDAEPLDNRSFIFN